MKLNKFFKWFMLVLILISVGLLVWGFVVGFESHAGRAVELLLSWTYAILGIALFCWIVLGLVINTKNDPKSLIRLGIILVGAAAIVGVAYLLASGSPAVGRENLGDPASTLKLTDTILILTAIAGVASILAIVVGEIRLAIVNRK